MTLPQDEVFEVRPLRGEIWPGSEANITVIFRPNISIDYQVLNTRSPIVSQYV
jgi:hypothetical protein